MVSHGSDEIFRGVVSCKEGAGKSNLKSTADSVTHLSFLGNTSPPPHQSTIISRKKDSAQNSKSFECKLRKNVLIKQNTGTMVSNTMVIISICYYIPINLGTSSCIGRRAFGPLHGRFPPPPSLFFFCFF